MPDVYFDYTLRGRLVAPEGSTLTEMGTGVRLPNGDVVKMWESLELHPGGDADVAENLAFDELEGMGLFYDGDMCQFEETELVENQLWPPA